MTARARDAGPSAAAGLALIVGTQFMLVLDGSITTMAIPRIEDDLQLGEAALSWVTNAYVLAFGGLLLLGGRIVDAFGYRLVHAAGLAVFALAALAAAVGGDAEWLIGGRALLGAASAALAPATLALLVRLFPSGAERNRALAAWGAAGAAGAPAGAMLGGLLTGAFGWKAVLLVNVPVCVAGLLLLRRMPPSRPARRRGRLGAGGALLATGATATLLAAVVEAGSGSRPRAGLLLVVAALLFAAFRRAERRTDTPLLPASLLRDGALGRASVIALLGMMSGAGMAFVLSLHLQRTLGLSPLVAGCAYLPYGAVAIASARGAAWLIGRSDGVRVIRLGLAAMCAGLLPLLALPASGGYATVVLPSLVLTAFGCAIFLVAVNVVALRGVAPEQAGVAGGLITTAQVTGAAIGLAVTVAAVGLAGGGELEGSRVAFAVDAALAAFATAAAFLLLRRSRAAARPALTTDQREMALR